MMGTYALFAEAFRYPAPGRIELLQSGMAGLPPGPVEKAWASFVTQIEKLSLSQWEELFTRTLDLNPPAAPYIGFQTWGESYQRGRFMAVLNQALQDAGIDLDGELPDHMVPVLRYLDAVTGPLPELVEVLEPAVQRMASVLRKSEPANPYLDLFEAVLRSVQALSVSAPQ